MAGFVLDASVAISWCFPGDPAEDTPYGRRVLKELVANDALVPEIWAFEIANSIFVSYSRRRRILRTTDYRIPESSSCSSDPGRTQSLWANVDLESLARRRNLAAYDAAYLDLALRRDRALATSDEPLRQAAIAEGITVLT
jgi:predicted nucleic acid-binding protein